MVIVADIATIGFQFIEKHFTERGFPDTVSSHDGKMISSEKGERNMGDQRFIVTDGDIVEINQLLSFSHATLQSHIHLSLMNGRIADRSSIETG